MSRPLLPALCALLALLGARTALAAPAACQSADVVAEATLEQHFPGLLPRVRAEIFTRDDIDSCARVALALRADQSILVEVTLPDGRSTSRAAQHPDDVIPTLQALLLIPKHPPAPPAAERKPAPSPASPAESPARDELGPHSQIPAPGVGVELSVIAGTRVGDGQASVALGAMSFLELSGWLLGFEGRGDAYQRLAGGPSTSALELGALLGKRLRFTGVTLDLVGGPAVAIQGGFSDIEVVANEDAAAPPMPPPVPPPEPSSGPVPRLLASARLGFAPDSVLRSFVAVDGTYGKTGAEGNLSAISPPLPAWTLGLSLGATVGTR